MKSLSLFRRRDVAETVPGPLLEYQSPTASLIAIPPSAIARWVPLILGVFVFVLVILSVAIPINIVVSGYGTVESTANIEVIQPLETSIIKSINVVVGQHVTKGQVLAELDPTFTQSDLGSLQAQFDSAQTDVERYRAEETDKAYVPSRQTAYTANSAREFAEDEAQKNSTLESYDTKVKSLEATLHSYQAQLVSYRAQYDIAAQVLAKRQELFRLNVGSQLDLLSAQSQADQLKGQVDSTVQAIAGAQQDLASMIAEENAYKQSFYAQAASSLASRAATMDDANSQLAKNQLRVKLVDIRADQDGSILTIAVVAPGTVLQSGDQLITMQPDGAKMQVLVNFPAEMAGNLAPGQQVAVKFLAFNYTTHGQAYGTLTSLTQGSFLPGEQTQNYAQSVNNGPTPPSAAQTSLPSTQVVTGLFYQGTVTIDRLAMRDVPPDFKPGPGMAVSVDAITGTRNTALLAMERIAPNFTEFGHVP